MNDAGKAKALFLAAIERDPSGACPTSLDESCGGDAWVRARVEKLPEAHRIQGALPSSNASARAEMPRLLEGHGTVIGPYTLIEPIGEGGMGVDYLAEQTAPVRRKVAIKIIKPGMDTNQVIARFEAERQALAMMAHPHIASVLDAGTTVRGRPYFGMELVRVIPITEYCDNKQLDIPARLRIFVRTCHAVQHAQQKGILHRDLKPSNILVTVLDDAPVPKIIDFGVAKAISGRLSELTLHTGCHQLVVPPLYMSPEQADLSVTDIDTRSEIYSLGVLLYELLTGTTPIPLDTIRHSSHDEIRRLIRDVEPPRPSSRLGAAGDRLAIISTPRKALPRPFRRSIRGELGWPVMKAMEKERGRRYQTVGDLAADVVRHLKGEPLEVGPASRRYRFKKFARRNKAILTTTVLVAMALIGGTAISIWQAVRAIRAERRTAATLRLAERHLHTSLIRHVVKDINKLVLDAVRRFRTAMNRRGKAGRKKKRGRKWAKAKAAAARRGMTVKAKAHFVFKRRYFIVKRREGLTESERDDLTRMLEYLPSLTVLRRFVDRIYWLFDTPKDAQQAGCRRAAIVRDPAFQAVPELVKAMEQLDEEKFPKLMAYLKEPVGQRVRTNNHVERTNRMFRFFEKVRYKWRRRRTLVRFVVMTLDVIWREWVPAQARDTTPVKPVRRTATQVHEGQRSRQVS